MVSTIKLSRKLEMSRLWHTNTHGIIVMYFVWAESAIVHGDFQQAQISFRLFWKRMLFSGTTICPNMQKEKKAPLVQICPKRKLLLLNARREEADFVSNYGYLQKMLKSQTILDLQNIAEQPLLPRWSPFGDFGPHGDQNEFFGPHLVPIYFQSPHFLHFRLKNASKVSAATI